MNRPAERSCSFETVRLRIGPWHEIAQETDLQLTSVIANILTESTTQSLPEEWQGEFSAERASLWISERDSESPTLLAVDKATGNPIGLVILFELPIEQELVDIRIGYILAEAASGRGLATELVAGLVKWARSQNEIASLTGGVATTNPASARVLTKNGFLKSVDSIETSGDESLYRLQFKSTQNRSTPDPDC